MNRTQPPDVITHPDETELTIANEGTRAATGMLEDNLIEANVGQSHLPKGFDDRRDPIIAEFQRPLELRKPGVLPAALRVIPVRPEAPRETALRIAEKVAGSLGTAPFAEPPFVTEASEEEGVASRALNAFEPKLRIRVHAVFCRNFDGKMSNGLPGQSRADLEIGVSRAIALANTIMATANIELVFYPTSDIEIVNDTFLNQDFVLPSYALEKLKQEPPLTDAQMLALSEQHSTNTHRNTFGATYPRKMVLLFGEGTTYTQNGDHLGRVGDVPVPMHYDNDSKADIAVWRPIDPADNNRQGGWHIHTSQHGGFRFHQLGQKTDIPVPADYDGDGKVDIAVWRPSTGVWEIINSSNGQTRTEQWGQPGDIPVPGNYTSKTRADFAVWRPSEGKWYIKNSQTGATTVVQWGEPGDIPVPRDYDGDGKTDMAVWRPSNGTWYIIQSKNNVYKTQQWGQPGDIPVPACYFGIASTDFAVWRPGEGNWYLLNAATGATQIRQWGQIGDVPVPRDYDGDGRADLAVWRPGEGQWYIFESLRQNYRGNDWQLRSPEGGGFSWAEHLFVRLGGGINLDPNDYSQAAFIAHEIGHYLHLAHTFLEDPGDNFFVSAEDRATKSSADIWNDVLIPRVRARFNQERAKDKNASPQQLSERIMDADRGTGVHDTPPDPGPDFIEYLNRVISHDVHGACGPDGSFTVHFGTNNHESILIAPDRTLVMSYFKGCPGFINRFSTQQAERMRNALIHGNRRPLVGVQLGDTAFPGEWVAAVWDPNPNGQFFTWDNTFDAFNTNYTIQRDGGFRLHSQQAYTKGGTTIYDGIWNPGNYQQDVIWGWTGEHFEERDTNNRNNGYVLHHLESYLLPDGQIRVNAIWNKIPGAAPTTWVQGWAEQHLAPKLIQMKNSGWRVKHLNALTTSNNGMPLYDVVWEQLTSRDEFVRLNMNGTQVVEEFGRQWNKGFKFRVLDTFRVGNEQRYAGVWNPNSNGQLVLWGHTREQIGETYDEMWQQGWKMGSMAMVKF